MLGFEYGNIDPNDTIPSRVIKVLLRLHLPLLRLKIEAKIKQGFELQMARGTKVDGMPITLHRLSYVTY